MRLPDTAMLITAFVKFIPKVVGNLVLGYCYALEIILLQPLVK